jgi:hypothetical protein
MRGSSGLVDGVVRSVGGVGLCVGRLVGPDVRVAEKIAGRDGDVMERGDIVNSSQVILRSLSEIRRQMPLPVSILRVDPCGVCLLHERIPVSGRVDDLLVTLAEVEILLVVEEKILRWGTEDD